jgi:branched-chain amino acid transport system permease protein
MGLNLPVPQMASIADQARFFYYAMLGVAAITFGAVLLTQRSRLGFGLRCIQQNEAAADMLGVNTTLYKVNAFILSGVFVGLAGAVYASWVHYIEPPDVFDVLYSVKPIVMVLLGGAGTLFGPLIGAGLFLSLEELVWRNYISVHTGVLGLLIVLLVLFLPKGVLSFRAMKA